MTIINILGHIVLSFGLFFIVTALVGLVRMPDEYSKIHAAGVSDSLGYPMCYLGLALISGMDFMSIKFFVIFILILIISPVITHNIALSLSMQDQKERVK